MTESKSKQIIGYRYLRALACVAVIIMHTVNSAEILYRDTLSVTGLEWSMIAVYIMMWAVPCFLMVTGALLLDSEREMSLGKIFKKYLFRVVITLIACVLVFRLFDMAMNGESFSLSVLGDAFKKLITGTSWAHLWYLYLLIGVYLLLPFYRVIVKYCKRRYLVYLVAVLVVFISVLPLLFGVFGWESAFTLHVGSIFPLYVFAGYILSKGVFQLNKACALGVLLLGTALTVIFSLLRYENNIQSLDVVITSYDSFFVILQSWGLFSLFLNIKNKDEGDCGKESKKDNLFTKFLLFIDDNCFGIYLIHLIWIRLVLRYMTVNPYEIGIWFFPVFIIANLLVSAVIVSLLRKIPGVKRVL